MCSWLLSGVTACTYLAFSSNMNPPSLVPSQSWDGIFVEAFVILVIWLKSTGWHGSTVIH